MKTTFDAIKMGTKFEFASMPGNVYVKECGWLATNLTLAAQFPLTRPTKVMYNPLILVVA